MEFNLLLETILNKIYSSFSKDLLDNIEETELLDYLIILPESKKLIINYTLNEINENINNCIPNLELINIYNKIKLLFSNLSFTEEKNIALQKKFKKYMSHIITIEKINSWFNDGIPLFYFDIDEEQLQKSYIHPKSKTAKKLYDSFFNKWKNTIYLGYNPITFEEYNFSNNPIEIEHLSIKYICYLDIISKTILAINDNKPYRIIILHKDYNQNIYSPILSQIYNLKKLWLLIEENEKTNE